MSDPTKPTELVSALRRIAKVSYGATTEEAHSVSRTQRECADLIEQQAARIAGLEAQIAALETERDALKHDIERHIANHAADLNADAPVAPAVDAQPVAWMTKGDWRPWLTTTHPEVADAWSQDKCEVLPLYATPPSEGWRKYAEELLRRIPTTPEQMVDFIGSHFDSMQADGWTDTLPSKPTGDLSMVRYSLTVHDLLSAFEWAGMDANAIDAALSQHKAGEKDD